MGFKSLVFSLLLGVAATGFFPASASAAERLVGAGQTYTTISAAIEAAADGDVIRIKDSATYAELLTINKRVDIVADANQSPTILHPDPEATSYGIAVVAGAAGGRLGSLDGGQIIINRGLAPTYATTSRMAVSIDGIGAGEEYNVENVYITGYTTGAITAGTVTAGVNGTLNIEKIVIDGGNSPDMLDGATKDGIRIHGRNNHNGIFNITGIEVKNITRNALLVNHTSTAELHNVTINLVSCDLVSLSGGGAVNIGNAGGLRFTMDNCFLLGGGYQNSWGAMRFGTNPARGDTSATLTLTNSVLAVWPGTGTAHVFGMNSAGYADNATLTIDHCDLINQLASGTTTRRALSMTTGVNRTITLTNNIIYGPDMVDTQLLDGINIASDASDTINVNHNNVFVSGAAYTGVTPGAAEVVPAVDPNYMNAAARDYRVGNTALHTRSTTGGVIGSNRVFVDFVPVELSTFSLQ